MPIREENFRDIFVEIQEFNWDNTFEDTLEGQVTGGTLNFKGDSVVRTTGTLSLIATDLFNHNIIAINKKILVKYKIIEENQDNNYYMTYGVFIITGVSLNHTINGTTINLTLQDLMCTLNGFCGGLLPSTVSFHEIENYDNNGQIQKFQPNIRQIITEAVHHWGGVPLKNIIIVGKEIGTQKDVNISSEINDNDIKNGAIRDVITDEYCRVDITSALISLRRPVQLQPIEGNSYFISNYPIDNWIINQENLYVYSLSEKDLTDLLNFKNLTFLRNKPPFFGSGKYEFLSTSFKIYNNNLNWHDIVFSSSNPHQTTIGEKQYYIYRIEDTLGYVYTDFVMQDDLIGQTGDPLTSILDKIKNFLGNYEYFFDVDGNFIFRPKKNYIFSLPEDVLEPRSDGNFYFNENNMMDRYIISEDLEADFDISNSKAIISYSNTPSYDKLKNDFTIWGKDNKNIHFHLILEDKDTYEECKLNKNRTYNNLLMGPLDSQGNQQVYLISSHGDNGTVKEIKSGSTVTEYQKLLPVENIFKQISSNSLSYIQNVESLIDYAAEAQKTFLKIVKESTRKEETLNNPKITSLNELLTCCTILLGGEKRDSVLNPSQYKVEESGTILEIKTGHKTVYGIYKALENIIIKQYWIWKNGKILKTFIKIYTFLQNYSNFFLKLQQNLNNLLMIAELSKEDIDDDNWLTSLYNMRTIIVNSCKTLIILFGLDTNDIATIVNYTNYINNNNSLTTSAASNLKVCAGAFLTLGILNDVVSDKTEDELYASGKILFNAFPDQDVKSFYRIDINKSPNLDYRAIIYLNGLLDEFEGKPTSYYFRELKTGWTSIYDMKNHKFYDNFIKNPWDYHFFMAFLNIDETMDRLDRDNPEINNGMIPSRLVSNIGQRQVCTVEQSVNCLFEPYPEEKYFIKNSEDMIAGKNNVLIPEILYDKLTPSGGMNSAYEYIRSMLHEYLGFSSSITIQCLPMYWLEPGNIIKAHDNISAVYGKYEVNSISLPLSHSGVMTVQATRCLTVL